MNIIFQFLQVESITGEKVYRVNLENLHELHTLGLDVEYIPRQGYNNGANINATHEDCYNFKRQEL